jgi:hypothetical protein
MVRFGMLWSDPYEYKPKKPIEKKVGEAVVAFHKRFYHAPTHCTLTPKWFDSLSPEEIQEIKSKHHIEVDGSANVQEGHLAIGYPEVPEWWNR